MTDEKKTPTNQDLVEAVMERIEWITKSEVATLVEQIFNDVKSALASGDKVRLSGFGNFALRDKGRCSVHRPLQSYPTFQILSAALLS